MRAKTEATWLEEQIGRFQQRIDRIDENPDGRMLRSNRLLYELERDFRIAQLNAWRTGEPHLATGEHPSLLTHSMGFLDLDLFAAADRTRLGSEFLGIVEANGLPTDACDRTVVCIAMCINRDFPVPNLVVATNTACDMELMSLRALGELFDIPTFTVDVGLEANEETLGYVADQLAELIEFAESKIPGVRWDEEKMSALIEMDKKAFECLRQIHEKRRAVPCLISGQDAFRLPRFPSRYHDPVKALRYFEAYRDEMLERAEKGLGALDNEKLRLMWVVTGPFYFSPFRMLEKRGVSVPALQFGMMSRYYGVKYGAYGDETEYGRRLTPLEEQARWLNRNAWGGTGQRWIRDTLDMCKDLSIDGMVYYVQMGCTASSGLARVVAEAAEQELSIPTLLMEGRQLDPSFKTQQECEDELDAFVELCLARKTGRVTRPIGEGGVRETVRG